ncbi:hypothetical protein ET445_09550 [Agromyces protaetiae]|uniref:N-formylglutamate amidohydrolase n=1 Tax=Agromyces protaetiae TaxID=2509455 RepID=A0A4P6FCY4_9MICO|nr:N-formylglutamate amidohydrolase [Agromyces protaetiae]QAY73546.1 hypothetical protein ET445_09550 [Agromyces protaetiae]
MDAAAPLFLPSGTVFEPSDIVHFAGRGTRSLDEALARADVIVSAPHAGSAIPEELAEFIAPEFTRRLQFDYTDCSTSPIVRRWAEIDDRIVVVENPHPRMVRDPNRERPADLAATLREALARVREAGAWNRVDLSGVDAIRPVTFSFSPLLRVPDDEAGVDRLVAAFERVGAQGVDVYERTRDDLLERLVRSRLDRADASGPTDAPRERAVTFLAFHDTMNRTTTREGAIDVLRDPADRLPDVVALSNRGDADGESRGAASVDDPITMRADVLRLLADDVRAGFGVEHPAAVALNQPYLGSYEIVRESARFRELASEADAAGLVLNALQAEFLREFLLGAANVEVLRRPGTGWIEPDAERVDEIAHACKRSFDRFRARWTE